MYAHTMAWFSSGKKIPHDELDDILRDIPGLQMNEQEYVKGVFARYRAGGISRTEVERAIRELKRDGDLIGDNEAKHIKEVLFAYLDRE